jgi:DNA-directed RNA polymerase subunit RPC12/RpoP
MKNIIDWLNRVCTVCSLGTYQETSIMDDIDGVVRCQYCQHKRARYG